MHETSPCWVYGHGPANQSNRCGASITSCLTQAHDARGVCHGDDRASKNL
ncbi:hypothetical protein AZ78_0576 [Lysobacter capsici AZ78]|uniref:Uncharacterized protein n=1 Tax=Lysobacter capsici AZ78 TaxID=1444315 RepID=A0A108U5Q0_9GAMM|nr:hypothetical protein AZ78_0576 [Lysobacter capsici AZ78]